MNEASAAPRLHFTKMHGAGNDFVVLDLRGGDPPPDAALAVRLADRQGNSIVGIDDGNRALARFIDEIAHVRPHPTIAQRSVGQVFADELQAGG